MSNYILLGAGFSRNWGGFLAKEVFEHLLSTAEVQQDPYLKELLWKHQAQGGFESALDEVQIAVAANPDQYSDSLRRFQDAILYVFKQMNDSFLEMPGMEFQNFVDRMLRTFLVQFDAIFTLNQDVLLEHHYCRHVELANPQRWNGAQLPGLNRIPNIQESIQPSWAKDTWVPADHFEITTRFQPYFKLHGSTNWRTSEGSSLLVMGGDKVHAIHSLSILAWYFEEFRAALTAGNSKLFVIGYGFHDKHVNDVIIDAVLNHNLKFFVLDRNGADVVRLANPSNGRIYAPNSLDEAFHRGLIGSSSRTLSEIFGDSHGSDLSHRQVINFFE